MAVALLAVLPALKQQIRRDREDELRHRGTMYMRAIQHYYKRNGRYPNSIEELESSNHIRFLRRRYKDPMSRDPQTGKERDFKLLHMQDVALNNGPVLGQGLPGKGSPGGVGGSNQLAQMQQLAAAQGVMGGIQPQSGVQNLNSGGSGADDSDSNTSGQGNTNAGGSGAPGGPGASSGPTTGGPTSPSGAGNGGLSGQTFGGGGILGVASTDKKDKAIHEFNKKNHYTDWYFIYDPSMDRGGLLIGPWQPLTIASGGLGQPIGASGTGQPTGPGTGLSPGGFGQSGFGQSGFGQSGFGQSPQNQPQNPTGNTPNN